MAPRTLNGFLSVVLRCHDSGRQAKPGVSLWERRVNVYTVSVRLGQSDFTIPVLPQSLLITQNKYTACHHFFSYVLYRDIQIAVPSYVPCIVARGADLL